MSDPASSPPQGEITPPTPRWAYWVFAVTIFLAIGGGGIEHHWPVTAIAASFGGVAGILLAFLARFIAASLPCEDPIGEARNTAGGAKVAGAVLLLAAIVTGLVLKSVTVALASAGATAVVGAATILINLKYDPS